MNVGGFAYADLDSYLRVPYFQYLYLLFSVVVHLYFSAVLFIYMPVLTHWAQPFPPLAANLLGLGCTKDAGKLQCSYGVGH